MTTRIIPPKNAFLSVHDSLQMAVQAVGHCKETQCAIVLEGDVVIQLLTEGDLRRGLAMDLGPDSLVSDLLRVKEIYQSVTSYVWLYEYAMDEDIKTLFDQGKVNQIPLLNDDRTLNCIAVKHLIPNPVEFSALIMAGGFGTRLRPYTDVMPKPMVRIAGMPMLERTVRQLVSASVKRIYISTHYLPEMIQEHFGDGERFGVPIQYLNEDRPLGTGGCLNLIDNVPLMPLLVINGDIQTKLNITAFVERHVSSAHHVSVATKSFQFQVPFGQMEIEDGCITSITEKPIYKSLVNAGIYAIDPCILENHRTIAIPYTMVDLIENLLEKGIKVHSIPIFEEWIDVGRPEDIEVANNMFS